MLPTASPAPAPSPSLLSSSFLAQPLSPSPSPPRRRAQALLLSLGLVVGITLIMIWRVMGPLTFLQRVGITATDEARTHTWRGGGGGAGGGDHTHSYPHPSKTQRWSPRPTSSLDWSTVPPFPTHTRNITRQLEWLDRYDTSPLHVPGTHPGIIVTFVNYGFMDMTLNWLCHIRALQISSYLIIAMDQDAFNAILKWDPTIHVYLWNKDIDLTKPESIADPDPSTITSTSTSFSADSSAPTAPVTAFVFNDGPFVDMMVRRLRFTIDMLRLWPHPIIFTDTDIILLQDILSDFVNADGDVVAQDDSGIACAGQILFRPTENVLLMLEDVLSSTISRQYHNEQLALHAFLHNPQYQSGGARALKFHLLPKLLYPSGDVVWGREKHQERVPETRQRIAEQGWLPASVHNNWIMTKQVKTTRFQEFEMWQVDDVDQGTCTYDALSDVYMPPSPRLNIHILAYKRVNSLKRLLTSLSTSHYDSRQINVTLHVDSPADRTDTATMTSVEASVKAFRDEWEWKYGHKILRQRQQHVGQNTQYYEIWEPPMSNDEVIIVLQDDEIMSPYWYTWLRKAIDTYYGTDPYMYGISLQRQYFVPGSPGTGPNPPTSAAQHEPQQRQGVRWKRDNRPLLYQQLGTWGQVFFPAHYRLFQSYTEAHRRLTYPPAAAPASDGSTTTTTTNPPVVPVNEMDPRIANLWSNGGYQGDVNQYSANGRTLQFNDVNWEYWFMAFTAEYGVYTMYTDFSNEKALLINNQEAGDHYATDAGPDAQLMNDASWNPTEHMQFPDISQQVVYDFWMKPVEARAQLSIRNMMMHKYWKDKEQKHLPQLPKIL